MAPKLQINSKTQNFGSSAKSDTKNANSRFYNEKKRNFQLKVDNIN